jgi:hypothetical protein
MKNKLQTITVFLTAFALCAPLAASAATKKSPSPAPSPNTSPAAKATTPAVATTPRAIPFHGMISAVDQRAKTFTIAGKEKSRVFKITDKTVLLKAGQTATMKDVTANEEVRGSYWKATDGSLEAKTVKLGPMTDAEKAEAEKHAKKKAAKSEETASPSASPAAKP